MVIWSLFDSETDTVKNVIRCAEVLSFGMGAGNTHIPINLAEPLTVIDKLKNYPKPDIVFAFPPCHTWLNITAGNCYSVHRESGMNLYWLRKWIPFVKPGSIVNKRLNGSLCALTAVKIIRHFKPKFFFVENPSHSQLFNFLSDKLKFHGVRNFTDYLSYGFDYHKATTIYSNVVLPLKRTGRRFAKMKLLDCPENDRTKVPEKLIGHIVECVKLNMFEQAFTI